MTKIPHKNTPTHASHSVKKDADPANHQGSAWHMGRPVGNAGRCITLRQYEEVQKPGRESLM